jgi:AAA15 family ATPase/GTPase
MARAKDSVLLIDEIDTGLHYSVMKDMWRLINQASIDFNVQVFATTHSQDCVYALACECKDVEKSDLNQITLQRIEVGKKRSIAFTEAEIQAVAARNIEAR